MFTLLLLILTTVSASAQKYNFDTAAKMPKTEAQTIGTKSVKTADKAVYKTISYPIYKSVNGKLFIVYKNSKGNYSKKYIPQA